MTTQQELIEEALTRIRKLERRMNETTGLGEFNLPGDLRISGNAYITDGVLRGWRQSTLGVGRLIVGGGYGDYARVADFGVGPGYVIGNLVYVVWTMEGDTGYALIWVDDDNILVLSVHADNPAKTFIAARHVTGATVDGVSNYLDLKNPVAGPYEVDVTTYIYTPEGLDKPTSATPAVITGGLAAGEASLEINFAWDGMAHTGDITAPAFHGTADSATNADTVDSLHATDLAAASHTHAGVDITSAVASATNADTVDTKHAADFANASHNHQGSDVTTAVANATNAVNADTLDLKHASDFANLSHTHFGSQVITAVANATDADTLDLKHASDLANAVHTHGGGDITSAVANATSAASATNADTVDLKHASDLANAVHTHGGGDITSAVTLAISANTAANATDADYAAEAGHSLTANDADTVDLLHAAASGATAHVLATASDGSAQLDGLLTVPQQYGSAAATYASATSVTISGDWTGRIRKGTRVRLYQSGWKYFYVVGCTYSAPNTTVTLTAGTDYTVANATITYFHYSNEASAFGTLFPAWFNYTPTWTATTTNPVLNNGTLSGKFRIDGDVCRVRVRLICGSTTTYGTGNYRWALPVNMDGANEPYLGLAYVRRPSPGADYIMMVNIASSQAAYLYFFYPPDPAGNNTTTLTPTVPITWAANDTFYADVSYGF